jgi:hypothetical protein
MMNTNSTLASKAADTGEVQNTPEANDAEYLSPVNVGGQQLMMDFDSGSSDFWVFSTKLPQAELGQHNAYNPAQSQTFRQLRGSTFNISYGDGSGASGLVGTETVNIGGTQVRNQAVEIATSVSQSFQQDTNNDGLVGLAFGTLNTVKPQKVKTFFENAMENLQEPVFTAQLKHATAGTYEFGAVDPTKFQGDLTYVPADTSQGFWGFNSDKFVINGQEVKTLGGMAIADTGTTLLLVDPAAAEMYYTSIPGAQNSADAGGFTIPCNQQLPSFGVGIGENYVAEIPGSLINFAPIQPGSSTCFGGIQSNAGQALSIYGDIMFKAQFVAFNGGNNSLGFAPHS